MKKIFTFLISLTFIGASVNGQVLLNEPFNPGPGGAAPTFPPTDWDSYEEDGNAMNTTIGIPAFINGSFQYGNVGGSFGGSAISSSIYDPRGSSDDWLISPVLAIPAATAGKSTILTYFQGTIAGPAPYNTLPDYELLISTTGKAVADFTDKITPTETTIGTNLFLVSYNLSTDYAGEDIYIAWRDISTDTYVFWIDGVLVETKDNESISINTVDVPEIASNGENVTISGSIVNDGAVNLTSYEVSWDDGSGTSNIFNVTGVDIPPLFTATFEHTTPLVASNPGSSTDVTVTVSNPNGVTDPDLSDNEATASIFVNNGTTVPRKVLLEEFSTAPCQYCPDGAVTLGQIKDDQPKTIIVQHHAGFQTDGMTIPEHSTYAATWGGGAPTAVHDRNNYGDPTMGNSNRANWAARGLERADVDSYVFLDIRGEYDGNTDILSLQVEADFKDYVLPGDIRLTVFLVEDTVSRVTGAGYQADWDQVNFYYASPGHPYEGVGTAGFTNPNRSWIEEYNHIDVVRDVWPSSDAWGSSQMVTTTSPAPGDKFTQSNINMFVDGLDVDKLSVVFFLSYFDNDSRKRGVLNAEQVDVLDLWAVGIEENASSVYQFDVFPNPSSSITNLKLGLVKSDDVELRLFDITGKELRYEDFGTMSAGTRNIELNVSDLANGFYFVNLTVGEETITRKISVNK